MQRLHVMMQRREPRWVLSPVPGFEEGGREGGRDIAREIIFNNRECTYCSCRVLQRGGGETCRFGPGFGTPKRSARSPPGPLRCSPPLLGEPQLPPAASQSRDFACGAARRASFCLCVLLLIGKQLGVRISSLLEGLSQRGQLCRRAAKIRRVMLDGGLS